jgi:hypothetical protein
MKRPARTICRPMRLPEGVESRLSAYATAATAAGISLLASTLPANAKIIYTPTMTPIPAGGARVLLDLNHDGIPDFSFLNLVRNYTHAFDWSFVLYPANQSNEIRGLGRSGYSRVFASALRKGFAVGPNKRRFTKNPAGLMGAIGGTLYGTSSVGQWLYTQRRYLGLKFLIAGQVHYGWARLNVTVPALGQGVGIQATLTGYAYETIPNTPIITGKITGPDVVTVEPASLGHLARGASAIPAWREKK